ncbi:MAG: hypothetical protein A3J52_00305 [Omnitrophica bacterium RIFCSPHIGHO2_02_FULL_49_9]|nr:MAG: hypothetical protein A3J52_00305 [Omnitrophica bacterium RIFCSPHIGHO2_02_FULL_49_9]
MVFPLFLCTAVLIHTPASAQANELNAPVQKLARGVTHVTTAVFHIPKEIIQTTMETEPVYLAPWSGMTAGLGRGGYAFGRQLVSGFVDIFTCFKPGGPLFASDSLFPEI